MSDAPQTPDELSDAWGSVRHACRLSLAHLLLQLFSGTFWSAAAAASLAAMAAIPQDILAAKAWLRAWIPISCAAISVFMKGLEVHAEALERCVKDKIQPPKPESPISNSEENLHGPH